MFRCVTDRVTEFLKMATEFTQTSHIFENLRLLLYFLKSYLAVKFLPYTQSYRLPCEYCVILSSVIVSIQHKIFIVAQVN